MIRNYLRRFGGAAILAVCASLSLTGCLSTKMYVDPALPTVVKSDIAPTAQPRPVVVLFEFTTRGKANARATAEIKPRVVAVLAESGLFSSVSQTAGAADAGVFKLTIDNVVDGQNAAAKGFGTGLTLGAVGSMVTDGYVATATYSYGGKVTEVDVRHAIHTTIGNKRGPDGLTPMEPQAAVHKAMDQIAWNALKQMGERRAFD
ncbi:MAG TPA: hypothetical protein VFE72_02110 [Lysobacter sp.]|nr:hypothetical protein [Lysobacter sp.]